MTASEFEDGIAACNLLPGPASTQLAIFCAWRVAGAPGAVIGGLAFIVPGLVVILGLASVFLAASPPAWVLGAAAGAGAAVAAVAVERGAGTPAGELAAIRGAALAMDRLRGDRWRGGGVRRSVAGAGAPRLWLRRDELAEHRAGSDRLGAHLGPFALAAAVPATGGLLALAWVALKVGALSYGGGFVIIPMMQNDAVDHYHWMTSSEFLSAVALGQVTPGPVVQTVAVVGYAAAGIAGGLFAALIAFAPSFLFVLLGARHFDSLRHNARVRAFLEGAGPAAIGAIIGVAIPLALALHEVWQVGVLAAAAVAAHRAPARRRAHARAGSRCGSHRLPTRRAASLAGHAIGASLLPWAKRA